MEEINQKNGICGVRDTSQTNNQPQPFYISFLKILIIVKIADLAKLTGKTIEELEAELAKTECLELNLNDKR